MYIMELVCYIGFWIFAFFILFWAVKKWRFILIPLTLSKINLRHQKQWSVLLNVTRVWFMTFLQLHELVGTSFLLFCESKNDGGGLLKPAYFLHWKLKDWNLYMQEALLSCNVQTNQRILIKIYKMNVFTPTFENNWVISYTLPLSRLPVHKLA